MLEQCRAY